MNERTVNIGLHVTLWVFFLVLPVLLLPDLQALFSNYTCHFINYMALNALLIFYFYFNYNFATPHYYFKQKYWTFFGLHIVFNIGAFIIFALFFKFFTSPCFELNPEFGPLRKLSRNILPRHFLVFFVSFFICVNKRLKSIEIEKTKADLQLLRTQVNPHFLFNVLNTIYGQAIIKSENTSDSIAKLADLMRYSLKEANVPLVNLQKEITYLESYIALQQLRLTKKTKVYFKITGTVHRPKIPPMLFIPFIENAFKYGVSNEVESTIKIIIEVANQQIFLLVENSKVSNQSMVGESNQIGIKNVKSRLDLIYGNQYTLDIRDTHSLYKVQLTIPS